MKRFEKKVVLITGAGSGLGQATAIQLAKEGANLSLVDVNEKGLEETKEKVLEANSITEVKLLTADVSDKQQWKTL
ncbi:SDR family NAD(P)-dependent oxidoreductase [Fervidibacillus albus]|uniref:SDR family NAD(P)-dependent oxidoreductase n=1 Tax=Fervidibacillus albus TaxID=2980026 RepID=A0A9E8LS51_9BACI|nr:SDR family NAD(P)-dependent oxidoreductase [Fervidibacillus albus]WAA08578.1 SDR family NAD(P)-dependent oxidoreductase [Fervidibacillus albus]